MGDSFDALGRRLVRESRPDYDEPTPNHDWAVDQLRWGATGLSDDEVWVALLGALAETDRALAALWRTAGYNAGMTATSTAKVSQRGQTNLPAELRHRWGIADGGEVGIIDLGDAALIVPGGIEAARDELRRVLRDRYEAGLAAIKDADLADQ